MGKREPKVGTRAWEKLLASDPRYVKATIESLTEKAAAGNANAAEQLARWLDIHPEHRAAVDAVSDVAGRVGSAWVKLVGGGDHLAERAARKIAEDLRAELLPADAGVVERVLVEAVVVARLVYLHAAEHAAAGSPHPGVVAARDRGLTAAQGRLFAAVKSYQLIESKKSRGLRPPHRFYTALNPSVS